MQNIIRITLYCLDEDQSVLESIKLWREEGSALKAYEKLRNKSSFEGFLLKGIAQHSAFAQEVSSQIGLYYVIGLFSVVFLS